MHENKIIALLSFIYKENVLTLQHKTAVVISLDSRSAKVLASSLHHLLRL